MNPLCPATNEPPTLLHNHARYDAEHHLVQVDGSDGWCQSGTGTEATACYTYDAEGQRMRRTVPGSGITDDYLYDLGGHYITQVSGGGWWIRGEIYAGGRHLATYENDLGTPTTFFGDGDSLGTERVETAVNGTACETITSLPFGDGLSTSGGCDPSAKYFEGKERDWESNLDNFGARFYSSQLGRWMSADWSSVPAPVPYANLSNPQTLNLYAMVADNPETFADLDGHTCGTIGSSDRNGCAQEGNSKTATTGEGFKAQKTGDGTDKSNSQQAQNEAEKELVQSQQQQHQQSVDALTNPGPAAGSPAFLNATLGKAGQEADQQMKVLGTTMGAMEGAGLITVAATSATGAAALQTTANGLKAGAQTLDNAAKTMRGASQAAQLRTGVALEAFVPGGVRAVTQFTVAFARPTSAPATIPGALGFATRQVVNLIISITK